MIDDRFIRYLEIYYKKNNTINDIPRNAIVEFEGSPLKIGEFLASIRRLHKLYIQNDSSRGSMSERSLNRYKVLNNLNIDWEPSLKKKKALEENDICLIYIEQYYKKHKTLEGIPDTFTIDGKEYSNKNFFAHIRVNHKKYISNENSKGSNSPTAIRRYQSLDAMNFDWEPLETKKIQYETEDTYMNYIVEYYRQNKTLSGIPNKATYNGIKLNVETFLADRRKKHKQAFSTPGYTPSELEIKRWQQLDQMSFDWTPLETKQQDIIENDKYIRYLKLHYEKHKTINSIKSTQEVLFEGETLKIGEFISDIRKRHLAYIGNSTKLSGIDTPLALKRYQELDDMEFDWRPSESQISIAKLARSHGLKVSRLRNYVERFDGNIEKALKICKALAKEKKKTKKAAKANPPSLSTIAQEFEVDLTTLTSLLNKPQLRTRRSNTVLMYDENTNLRQYCIDNGLNYTVIQKAVKLKMKGLCDEDLQSLINRCIIEYKINGQQRPSTWIYSKYGNEVLVSHLLTFLNLDSDAILHDMSKNCINLEQAIENNCFQRISKQEYNYLEFIYREMVKTYKDAESNKELDRDTLTEIVQERLEKYIQEYSLTAKESELLNLCFSRYTNAIEQYRLFNVGFEKDPEKKIQKILEYNLDEDEIEEAFFMPLKFDQKTLTGRDSELYQRRVLLKNIIVSWGYISETEQKEKINKHSLTSEEIKYVVETRRKIDTTKAKVLSKK